MSRRWLKFWPQDWQRDPALRSCGVAARGLWMDLICIAHDGQPYGHVTINGKPASLRQIGTITGIGEKEARRLISELEDAGVFSRSEVGAIYSRRMVRDNDASMAGREAVTERRWNRADPNRGGNSSGNDNANTEPIREGNTLEAEAEAEAESFASLTPRARDDFDLFLERYPNKGKPDAARRAWNRAVRGATAAEIMAGLEAYPFRTEQRYQPFAANWLDDGGWKGAAPQQSARDLEQAEQDRRERAGRWLDRLRTHHGDALNGTTVDDVARASQRFVGEHFVRWLNGIEYGEAWLLDEIKSSPYPHQTP